LKTGRPVMCIMSLHISLLMQALHEHGLLALLAWIVFSTDNGSRVQALRLHYYDTSACVHGINQGDFPSQEPNRPPRQRTDTTNKDEKILAFEVHSSRANSTTRPGMPASASNPPCYIYSTISSLAALCLHTSTQGKTYARESESS
jgi:hypothetical protein